MPGILNIFRDKISDILWKDNLQKPDNHQIDSKIALGVLLWVVADADSKFLPEEKLQIEQILTKNSAVEKRDIPIVMESIKQAKEESIDLYRFTSEIKKGLAYREKTDILKYLFSIACSDGDLDNNELELIRKISDLLGISHSDFVNEKIKIKKECGIKTAGGEI